MRALALTAVAALAFAGAAQAQVPPKIAAACTAESLKLCSGVVPGGGRILECIIAHVEQVGATCKTALSEELAKRDAAKGDAAAAKAAAAKKAAAKNAATSKDAATPNGATAPAGTTAPGGAAKQ